MTEFSIEFLASQAGIVAAIMVITEVIKWVGGLKDNCLALRLSAVVVGIGLSLVWLPTVDVRSAVVAVLNGCLCALVAMKGYELAAPVARRIWTEGE